MIEPIMYIGIGSLVAGLLVIGGVAGTAAGLVLGRVLGARKGLLERGFAAVVIAVGGYVIASSM